MVEAAAQTTEGREWEDEAFRHYIFKAPSFSFSDRLASLICFLIHCCFHLRIWGLFLCTRDCTDSVQAPSKHCANWLHQLHVPGLVNRVIL